METKQASFTILMFPFLAHGQICPYLEVAKNLSTKNFKVFFCSTPNNLTSIRDDLETTSDDVSIHQLELHMPPLSKLPPEYHTTKNVPSDLMPKLIEAFHMLKSSFSTIITSLKPDVLIYDLFPSWAPTVASSLGIPAIHFATSGAASYSVINHLIITNGHSPFPYGALIFRDYELKEFQSAHKRDDDQANELSHFKQSSNIVLMRTCRGIEGKYMDYLSTMCQKEIIPVGPLIVPSITKHNHSKNVQWLNTKKQFSTIFISFRSENYLSKNQITEMAKGLELASNVNFIWVLRFPSNAKTTIDDALPEGFLDRVKERGMIVQWAPQATVLQHPSIGAFVSHCIMSSLIESVYFGVSVIGIPFRIDQPLNAKLLVEKGFGIEVIIGENGHFTNEEVANVIDKVFVLKMGDEMRLKAAELSNVGPGANESHTCMGGEYTCSVIFKTFLSLRSDGSGYPDSFALRSTDCPESKSTETMILSCFQKLQISPTDPEFIRDPEELGSDNYLTEHSVELAQFGNYLF